MYLLKVPAGHNITLGACPPLWLLSRRMQCEKCLSLPENHDYQDAKAKETLQGWGCYAFRLGRVVCLPRTQLGCALVRTGKETAVFARRGCLLTITAGNQYYLPPHGRFVVH